MSDRDDLTTRSEVLSVLADQLSEQLAVERRANDELRSLLRDGHRLSSPPTDASRLAPVTAVLAGVAVVAICAAAAVSWLRPTAAPVQAPMFLPAAASPIVTFAPTPVLPAPNGRPWAEPVEIRPIAPPSQPAPAQASGLGNPRDCGRIVSITAARCLVTASGDEATGEYMLRNLILAHTLLGDRGRARPLASRYFAQYGSSPFAQQIRQLGY
jgi:hypothetical protein